MALFTGSIDDIKKAWFDAQGFPARGAGSLSDQQRAFLRSKLSSTDEDLQTLWYNYLASLGHTGSFNDMYMAAMIKGVAGLSSMSTADVERSFYGSSLNVFL